MHARRRGHIRDTMVRLMLPHPATTRAAKTGQDAPAPGRAGNCGCSEREAIANREAQRRRLDALEKLLGPI